MWQVFRTYNIPNNIINILKAMHLANTVDIKLRGQVFQGFAILCGIWQGCPASGSLFALLMDPFVKH